MHRAGDLAHGLKVWTAVEKSVGLVTLTMRHHRGDRLVELVKVAREAWRAVASGRRWKSDHEHFGIEWIMRVFECTVGDEHGWHPHFHVLIFFDRVVSRETIFELGKRMWMRWDARLESEGCDSDRLKGGLDARVMRRGDEELLGRYAFKLALEAFGLSFKQGRVTEAENRHRTPFQVMEDYAVARMLGDVDSAQADLALIHEWQAGMVELRMQQARWPPKLRDLLAAEARELGIGGALTEREKTDEEIAEEEIEGSYTLGWLPTETYTRVIVYELDTLRAACRRGGVAGIVAWFRQRGLPLRLQVVDAA
jgi:hypothetical protein